MQNHDARNEALLVLPGYTSRFPQEAAQLADLQYQLQNDAQDVFARSNMLGHITTSALVLDEKFQKVLLIHHNVYNRWLPPGGHYEPGEPEVTEPTGVKSWLWPSARREVLEETGVQRVLHSTWSHGLPVPLDIDTHPIAANPKKAEGQHFHHDFMYLARGWSNEALKPQLEEVSSAKWEPMSRLAALEDPRMQRVYAKLVQLGLART